MIILQETNLAQTIRFIPREYSSTMTYSVKIVSETENKNIYSQNFSNNFQSVKYYYEIMSGFSLKQDNFYMIEITDDSDNVVFRDKIFCTNQQISDYTVNSNTYTTHSSTNEFIII